MAIENLKNWGKNFHYYIEPSKIAVDLVIFFLRYTQSIKWYIYGSSMKSIHWHDIDLKISHRPQISKIRNGVIWKLEQNFELQSCTKRLVCIWAFSECVQSIDYMPVVPIGDQIIDAVLNRIYIGELISWIRNKSQTIGI